MMNEYKRFKDSLGMEDGFELHTWDEINRLNKVCEDYFIYRGYAVDDECVNSKSGLANVELTTTTMY